ncbi:MAG: hypothetical protein K2P21_03895 [Lachnospiraceae bacterium]|nr:hypothetical protein [Lachnospiraceae bacterium]
MKKTKKVAMNETAKVTAPKVEKVPEKKPAVKEAVAAPAKKEEVKEIVQNAEEVKETVKKETAKAEEKATAKKSAAKKTPIKETVYVQYLGKEINHQDIVKQVKEVWTKQLKKKVGDMKSITIYFKPEENTAYYVINDDVKGSISL